MGIDNKTKPIYINLNVEDNTGHIALGKKQAEEDDLRSDEKKYITFSDSTHKFNMSEYYFYDGEITISGTLESSEGEVNVFLTIPLSDTLLIDILSHASKKFNKLKTAMENLK